MKNKLIIAALFLLILLLLFLLQSSARPQSSLKIAQQTAAQSGEAGWDLQEFDPSLDVEGTLSEMVTIDLITAFAVAVAALARRSRPLGWRQDLITINPS